MIPIKIAVRFDKRDRTLDTFWVVNKKVFTAAERVSFETSPYFRERTQDSSIIEKFISVYRILEVSFWIISYKTRKVLKLISVNATLLASENVLFSIACYD